jgi:hypothetical protein
VNRAVATPVLVGLDAAGTPAAWRAAGFAVDDAGTVAIGQVRVTVGMGGRGISGWTLTGVPPATAIDGLRTRVASDEPVAVDAHPNGALRIDHLVVWSGDDARTVRALEAHGFAVRRVREDARPGQRQTFLRAGEVIVELVASTGASATSGTPRTSGTSGTSGADGNAGTPGTPGTSGTSGTDERARFYGIAVTVRDLDRCAALLGDALGPIGAAVQPGRRIATLRGDRVGLPVPIAFMSA